MSDGTEGLKELGYSKT